MKNNKKKQKTKIEDWFGTDGSMFMESAEMQAYPSIESNSVKHYMEIKGFCYDQADKMIKNYCYDNYKQMNVQRENVHLSNSLSLRFGHELDSLIDNDLLYDLNSPEREIFMKSFDAVIYEEIQELLKKYPNNIIEE